MDNTSSRRAFALDSRAVWVEQQITRGVIVPRDNLVLGPGEYNPMMPAERHVSTPVIGATRHNTDFFPTFRHDLNFRGPSTAVPGSPSRTMKSPTKYSAPLRDFSTVFHNDESRHGLDPNQIFCPTPGAYLPSQSLSKVVKSDGVTETRTVPFSPSHVPHGDRNQTKQALPTYDPKYESPYIRSVVKQGTFDKAKRIEIPSLANESTKKEDELLPNHDSTTFIDNNSSTIKTYSTVSYPSRRLNSSTVSSINFFDKPMGMSVYEYRCSLVALPKLKMRQSEVLTFDASSYNMPKDQRPISLTPNVVKQKAKVQLYDKIMAIPRRHQSSDFPMRVTVPLW